MQDIRRRNNTRSACTPTQRVRGAQTTQRTEHRDVATSLRL
jgi:hypothetical protein